MAVFLALAALAAAAAHLGRALTVKNALTEEDFAGMLNKLMLNAQSWYILKLEKMSNPCAEPGLPYTYLKDNL